MSCRFSASDSRALEWFGMTLYFSGGIDPRLDRFDNLVESGTRRFQSERFITLRPPSTSFCTSQEAGATLVYQGHLVRLLWQSSQEFATISFAAGLANRR